MSAQENGGFRQKLVLFGHSDAAERRNMTVKIPKYALYGHPVNDDGISFAHSQSLFSNTVHANREIRPHRHTELHQLVVLQTGTVAATLEGADISLSGPVVVWIPTNCVHGFGYSATAKGRIVTIADTFLRQIIGENARNPEFAWLDVSCSIDLSNDEGRTLVAIMESIHKIEQELSANALGKASAIAAALTLVLVSIGRANVEHEFGRAHDVTHQHQKIGRRFRELASQYYRDHWSVEQYSDALGVSSKQLNRICSQLLGQSPLRYVRAMLLREAKRRLVYTNASVTEICYALGFKDPAYFSRFFRLRTGKSPRDYSNN